MENLEQQFIDEKLSYEEVIKQIDVYQYVKDFPTYFSDTNGRIRALNGSRIAYKNGISYENNKQYVNAINELQKVIAADSHYEEAQKKIESLMPFYKKEMLANAKKLADAKKYEEAIESLNEALIMLPKDSDLTAKRKEYQSLKKKADEAAGRRLPAGRGVCGDARRLHPAGGNRGLPCPCAQEQFHLRGLRQRGAGGESQRPAVRAPASAQRLDTAPARMGIRQGLQVSAQFSAGVGGTGLPPSLGQEPRVLPAQGIWGGAPPGKL